MRSTALLAALSWVAVAAFAAPLTPTITGHDLSFGAYNQGPVEYQTNGNLPDTLVYMRGAADGEVTTYWPSWPNPPAYPVWSELGIPYYGGDFVLGVQFTGQDAPYLGPGGDVDVSLTGTGLNTAPGAADLEIYGTVYIGPQVTRSGLLWAIDLANVSLYGYSNHDSYVLEGTGTIVDGLLASQFGLIGTSGAMRGHLDFVNRPAGWMPSLYDPLGSTTVDAVRAVYSGETGVPEPMSCMLLAAGILALRRR